MFDRAQSLSDQSKRKANLLAQQVLWLVLGLLLSLSGFAANAPSQASQAELSAYKDLQQSKLDALKEAQHKQAEIWKVKAEALDKRIDDQLSQVSRSVDQFGVVVGLLGLLITVIAALVGFFAYQDLRWVAIKAAQEQAASTATSWHEKYSSDLQETIQTLEDLANGRIDAVKDYANQEADAVFAIQRQLGYTPEYFFAEIKRIAKNDATTPPPANDATDTVIDKLCSKARLAFEAKRYEDARTYWSEALSTSHSGQLYRSVEIRVGLSISNRLCHSSEYTLSSDGLEFMWIPDKCRAMYQHELADTLTQKGKLKEASSSYHTVSSWTSNQPDMSTSKVVLSATVSASVLRLLIAKRRILADDYFVYLYRDLLNSLEEHGNQASILANGVVLAIRAYVHHLLGHEAEAKSDLSNAFHASENGGAVVRDSLGQLLRLYANPKDQAIRELVDRLWRDFQASSRS